MRPLGALMLLILMVALEVGSVIPSMLTVSGDGNAGPVFLEYVLPDGDMWTSADFPVEVCICDPDGIDSAWLMMSKNDTWVRWYLDYHYRLNETTVAYDSVLPFRVEIPPPGLTVNYTFRFEANDTLGNIALTDNITTSVYRGEGPIFVSYGLDDGDVSDNGMSGCRVVVADPDGIDTVQLHIWDPHSESWSTKVMSYEQDTLTGEEYMCLYNVTAPYDSPPAVYRFRLEANDTLGNSVVSCDISRWYLDIISTVDTTTGTGFPVSPEALVVVGVVAGCIAVIVVLRFRHRP